MKVFTRLNSLIVILTAFSSFGQVPDYNHLAHKPNANFDSIAKITQHYFDSTRLDTVARSGYKQFKRWEWFWKTRVGNETNPGSFQPAIESLAAILNANLCSGNTYNENWTYLGHNETESNNNNTNFERGQGILIKVHVDLVHDITGNTIYAGSNSGGLWRTVDAKSSTGPHWKCLTKNLKLPGLGVNDIAVHPTNPNIIFISTGIGFGDKITYGMGILKTTDGQSANPTWDIVNDVSYDLSEPSKFIFTQGIFFSPNSSSTIFVLMKNEIWKSTDGGNSFSKKYSLSGNRFFRDMVFLPSNTETIFVSSNDFYPFEGGATILKSNDNGENWTDIKSLIGIGNFERIDLAVTSNSPNMITASGTNGANPQIFTSSNSGLDWTIKSAATIGDNYILVETNDLFISPNNPDIIYLGGVRLTKSSDGGSSFSNLYSNVSGIVHSDIRNIEIYDDGNGNDIIYSANDGGLSISTNSGNSWTSLNGKDLGISQIYGFDMNLNKDWIITGCQDLAIYQSNNNVWKNVSGLGDAFRVAFDHYSSTEKVYVQGVRQVQVSNNKGQSFTDFDNNQYWESAMEFDSKGNLYLARGKMLLRKKPNESSFKTVENFSNIRGEISSLGFSKSDPNIIYVGTSTPSYSSETSGMLFRSNNGLNEDPTFSDISSALDCERMGVSDIEVDPYNPNHFWVATGKGFVSPGSSQTAKRIQYSSNGGSTFNYIHLGLTINDAAMTFPVNVMVFDEASGGLYIGTDIGVYYNADPKSINSVWVCFNQDMPVAIITDLKIDYCNRKIIASTWGYGLWESNLAEKPDENIVLTGNDQLMVENNEIRIINSDITINNGSVMTINGIVKMASNRKISVKPGGKLVVNGGKITSICNEPWQGIVLEGNPTKIQNPIWQGVIELNNQAVIENAIVGIQSPSPIITFNSMGLPNPLLTKGIIKATDATFKNNASDVIIYGFTKTNSGSYIPNSSYFKNCKFITTNENKITALKPHIRLGSCNSIAIQGCTFSDQRSGATPKIDGRIGISASNATFNINDYSKDGTIIHSQFLNLKQAIISVGAPSETKITIFNSTIECYKGIYLFMAINPTIFGNTFKVKNENYIVGSNDYPYGLYFDKTIPIDNESNFFQGINTVPNGINAGLIVRSTGPNFSEIFNNDFHALSIGVQALNDNVDEINLYTGLTFRCNKYLDCKYDFDIYIEPSSSTKNIGICPFQGTKTIPPNNTFSKNNSILLYNINNTAARTITYKHQLANLSDPLVPAVNKNTYTEPETYVSGNFCNPTYRGPCTPCQLRLPLLNNKTIMENLNATWNSLIDNGNSPTNVVSDIENAKISNADSIYNKLMSYSPWLSVKALGKLASMENVFSDEQIKNVMVSNPHSGRSAWILEILSSRTSPFSSSFIEEIENSTSIITSRDSLSWLVSDANNQYDKTLNNLLGSFMDNDTIDYILSLDTFLNHSFRLIYRYELARIYFERGMYLNYQTILDSILLEMVLTEEEILDHEIFSSFYSKLKEWKLDSLPLPILNNIQLNWLKYFYNEHKNMPGIGYSLLALNDSSFNISDPIYISDTSNFVESFQKKSKINQIQNQNVKKFNIYPNPTNNSIKLECNTILNSPLQVIITDQYGKKVAIEKWTTKNNILNIDLSYLNVGVYYCSIYNDYNLLETQRVILIK